MRLLGNRSGRTTRFAPAGCVNPVRPKARSPVRTALAQARQRPSDDQHEIGVRLYVEEGAQGLDRSATHRDRHWLHFGCTAEVDRQIVNNASALLSYYRHRPMLRLSRRPSGAGIALAKAKEGKTNYRGRKPSFRRDQFDATRDMLNQNAGIGSIAKATGLSRQPIYRIRDDQAGAKRANTEREAETCGLPFCD